MKAQCALLTCFAGIVVFAMGCGSMDDGTTTEEERSRLDTFVDAALAEEVSVADTEDFYISLSDKEREYVNSRVLSNDAKIEPKGSAEVPTEQFPTIETQAAGSVWNQPVENVWTWDYPNKLFSTLSYVDWRCDDDPSDMEYVFYYPFPGVTPSAVRWTSTSSQVYLAFMAAYGGNLTGFGYNYGEVRLCIGDRGVAVAGGEAKVKSSIFVHY